MLSGEKNYQSNQGMEELPGHEPPQPGFRRRLTSTVGEKLESSKNYKRKVQKWKEARARDLLTSLNGFSTCLFATISVAERQIAVLQDLHKLFLTSHPTKAKDHEKGYSLRPNPFYKSVARIPILSEYPEQVWSNILDAIDEMVRERESFIKKLKELEENMDIRRKIVSFSHLKW